MKTTITGLLALAVTLSTALCAPRSARAGDDVPPPGKPALLAHAPYLTSGFSYYGSDRRVIAGLGGGLGYRLDVGEHLAFHVEGRWLVYVANAFAGALGASYRVRVRSWEPTVGLQLAGYAGQSIKVLSTAAPSLPPPFAWAVQGRLGLLRFTDDRFTASALAVDVGWGADAGSSAFALSVALLEIGIRF